MDGYRRKFSILFALLIGLVLIPPSVFAGEPPGANLLALDYTKEQGIAVLARYELFRSSDGVKWAPAGLADRGKALSAVGMGKNIILVATEEGTLYRSVGGGPFTDVKAPKDPFGRKVKGVRFIAIHPKDEEIMLSSGQGVVRSVDKGETWEPIAEPFWKNPDAREIIAVGYAKNDPVVVTRNGPYRRTSKGFERITKGLPKKVRPTVASVFEGRILMALPGEGIFLATKDSKWSKLKGAPGDPIAFVGFAKGSYLAARPTTALHRGDSKGKSWSPVGQYSPSYIPVDSVSTPMGDFLVLRGKGLVKLAGDKYEPVSLPGNLSSVLAHLELDGKQLAGTQGGVFLSSASGTTWQDVTPESLGSAIGSFLKLGDGRILLGAEGAGVFVSSDGGTTWRAWNIRLGTANTIKGLITYNSGVLAATENGLMWTKTGQDPNWQSLNGGIGRTPVVDLEYEGNNYWIAVNSGVYKARDNEKFSLVPGFAGRATAISVEKGKLLGLVNCRILLSAKGKQPTELPWKLSCIATDVALVEGVPHVGTTAGVYRWSENRWSMAGSSSHPVSRLVREKGAVRVVTKGAGTWYIR